MGEKGRKMAGRDRKGKEVEVEEEEEGIGQQQD